MGISWPSTRQTPVSSLHTTRPPRALTRRASRGFSALCTSVNCLNLPSSRHRIARASPAFATTTRASPIRSAVTATAPSLRTPRFSFSFRRISCAGCQILVREDFRMWSEWDEWKVIEGLNRLKRKAAATFVERVILSYIIAFEFAGRLQSQLSRNQDSELSSPQSKNLFEGQDELGNTYSCKYRPQRTNESVILWARMSMIVCSDERGWRSRLLRQEGQECLQSPTEQYCAQKVRQNTFATSKMKNAHAAVLPPRCWTTVAKHCSESKSLLSQMIILHAALPPTV